MLTVLSLVALPLVALPTFGDLFICAKDLFIAATAPRANRSQQSHCDTQRLADQRQLHQLVGEVLRRSSAVAATSRAGHHRKDQARQSSTGCLKQKRADRRRPARL